MAPGLPERRFFSDAFVFCIRLLVHRARLSSHSTGGIVLPGGFRYGTLWACIHTVHAHLPLRGLVCAHLPSNSGPFTHLFHRWFPSGIVDTCNCQK
jgi:hypothetical protein